jgi:hypothetical protein
MDEQIYIDDKNKRHVSIIAKGNLIINKKKIYWFIISYGSYPCSYIAVPKGHKFYEKQLDSYDDSKIHVGVTPQSFPAESRIGFLDFLQGFLFLQTGWRDSK